MTKRHLYISQYAEADLEAIWLYRFEQIDESSADQLLDRIYNACTKLTLLPELGRRIQDLPQGVRRIIEGNFAIYYRIQPERIELVRILHNSRDFKRHLK